jgi:hypothetical protein
MIALVVAHHSASHPALARVNMTGNVYSTESDLL